tara:strand:- start:89 stop:343 length:255 start_codon:yes stop_codon:yes gene_type:complete
MILLILIIIFGTDLAIATEENENSLITELCLIGFKSEMEIAGINPPQGMAKFTCDCFTKRISGHYSLNEAQKKCKEEASKNFDL